MAQELQLKTGLDTSGGATAVRCLVGPVPANFDRLLWNGEYYDIDAEVGHRW